jgi:GMP synthase-like glutamine amidotransferase
MNTLCVLQHTEGEFLGLMEDHFESRAIRFSYVRPFVPGAAIPASVGDFAGLVLLGAGPRGIVSGDLLPSLGPELRLAGAFLAAGRPVIGIGLGAAILAVAAGGGAEAAPLRFVVGTARRTDPHALAGHLPAAYPLVQYTRDRAIPPPGGRILAVDEAGAPALFQIGRHNLGFVGHPGMKTGMIEDLVMEFDETPADLTDGLAQLAAVQRKLADALSDVMVGLVKVTGLMQAA